MTGASVTSGSPDDLAARLAGQLDDLLRVDDREREARYPGATLDRQPVHTVYIPADQFRADSVAQWRAQAIESLDRYGPIDPHVLPHGADTGRVAAPTTALDDQVRRKLQAEPIEDLRIDFEDGYGLRTDAVEDADVRAVVVALRSARDTGMATHSVGLRIKSLEALTRMRAVRTIALFLESILVDDGVLPAGFVITLPKVTSVAQILAMNQLCGTLEAAHGLPGRRLRYEIQIETPQAILAADGTALVARMIHASDGRCAGLHYGTYDYSASVGIAAAFQSMEHPAADYAKSVMQVAAAGTGIPLSDGSTNLLPVGTTEDVHAGWQLHARLVRRSLERGFYQGWDLHPAQLPTRFAATFAFYRESMPAAVARLQRYLQRSSTGILDEPATAQALAAYLCRGLDCGAIDVTDIAKNVARNIAKSTTTERPDETGSVSAVTLDRPALESLARRNGR
ncbi:DUF6986 family protein [Jatrophihabitans sp. DSM 45814]